MDCFSTFFIGFGGLMRFFRKVKFAPCVESIEQRFMASGDLLLAMGCSTNPPIMGAPPTNQPNPLPDVPDPDEILINPYQYPPVTPVGSTMDAYGNPYGSSLYTVAVPVQYNPYAAAMA